MMAELKRCGCPDCNSTEFNIVYFKGKGPEDDIYNIECAECGHCEFGDVSETKIERVEPITQKDGDLDGK